MCIRDRYQSGPGFPRSVNGGLLELGFARRSTLFSGPGSLRLAVLLTPLPVAATDIAHLHAVSGWISSRMRFIVNASFSISRLCWKCVFWLNLPGNPDDELSRRDHEIIHERRCMREDGPAGDG